MTGDMKVLIYLFWLPAICLLSSPSVSGQPLKPYPLTDLGIKSEKFTVTTGRTSLQAYNYLGITYVRFALDRTVKLQIASKEEIKNIRVTHGLPVSRIGNKISLTLRHPGNEVLTINGRLHLFVLADPVSTVGTLPGNLTDISNYGVDATGSTTQTNRLQRAIDEAAAQNRVLYFPAGIYKTGTLRLRSRSHLFLSAGAVIRGSDSLVDYPVDPGRSEPNELRDKAAFSDNGESMTYSRLILIDSARDVSISGTGVIDGNGRLIRGKGKPANLLRIRNSSNVTIENVGLFNSAAWTAHILYSSHVRIRNVRIINCPDVKNTDGFDPDASNDVRIENCFAYCSDDNVAVKISNNGGLKRNCDQILISNCVFLTKKSALKVGTESKGGSITNVLFKGNYIVRADRGIVLYDYDGSAYRHISFIDNYFQDGYPDNQRKAVHFEIKNRSGSGQIRDVLISNCQFSEGFFQDFQFSGLDQDHLIDGVVLRRITLGRRRCRNLQDLPIKANSYVSHLSYQP